MRIIAFLKSSKMKKYFTLAILFCSLTTIIAQTTYEKGNYIDNTGIQIDGYIKNIDWKDNPVSFEFSKTSDGQKSQVYLYMNAIVSILIELHKKLIT